MVARNNNLPIEQARETFSYNKETGEITYLVNTRTRKIGDRADVYQRPNGYLCLYFPVPVGRVVRAHRIAWLLATGALPDSDIDHINGDRKDNRWINLRAVDRATNLRNTTVRAASKTGFKCVEKRGKKFLAYFCEDHKKHYLGSFDTPERAAEVARDLGWGRHLRKATGSEFSRD